METYQNLTSLAGLTAGDIVVYSGNDISIDFANQKVFVEIIGKSTMTNWVYTKNGGTAEFKLDSSKLPRKILTWSSKGGSSLCYSDGYDRFYRFGVAGDCGVSNTYTSCPYSGGTLGPNPEQYNWDSDSHKYTQGGSQTEGGKSRIYGYSVSAGTSNYVKISKKAGFGTSAEFTVTTTSSTYKFSHVVGGAGWYNAGTMCIVGYNRTPSIQYYGSGAGSGFILGLEGTSYPSGYLGDDEEIITTLMNAISERSLNAGKYTFQQVRKEILGINETGQGTQTGVMRLTILFDPDTQTYLNLHYKDTVEKRVVYKNSQFNDPNFSLPLHNTLGYYYDSSFKNRVSFPIEVGEEEIDIYVKLEEIPMVPYEYTGAKVERTLSPGKYKLQVWGAQGGSYSSTYQGGYGGYAEGIINITEDTPIFVYVGGQGKSPGANTSTSTAVTCAGGFNGGGRGNSTYFSSTNTIACSGGGGTDIRVGQDSLYARVIVAGGGAGSTNSYNALNTRYGGGETAGAYSSTYQATQTSGNAFGIGGDPYQKSNYKYCAAGSGGGWYGGKSSANYSDSTGYSAYTSGGSGYVYTEATAVNYPEGCLLEEKYYLESASTKGYSSNAQIPTTDLSGYEVGHSGNGYAIITRIGDADGGLTVIPYYNGTEFVDTNIKYYNGVEFVDCDAFYYNGIEFVKVGAR